MPARLNSCLILVTAALWAIGATIAASAAAGNLSQVDIPAQGLSSALTEFGRETATEIVFAPATVANLNSTAVTGDYPRLATLERLLAGTGLQYRLTAQGVIVVEAPAEPAAKSRAALDALTVEAARQREAVRHEIPPFVSAITVHANDESLASWHIPICPLVAGLTQDAGEFVLWRVSQAAREASAPLAPLNCHPNFFLVVAKNPAELLAKWYAHHPQVFNDSRGVAGIKRVINSDQPIRIWYNVDNGCPGTLTYEIAINEGRNTFPIPSCTHTGHSGSRLAWEIVRVITSVIILADADRIRSFNVGQLADYAAIIGMAQIHMLKDPGTAPTILRLFNENIEPQPQGLSPWDKAFLKALYNTYPDNVVQISQMETKMLQYLTN
jgi:hypothetical protein